MLCSRNNPESAAISSISNLQILQIPISYIFNHSISPFHGIPSDPMPAILSPQRISHSLSSCFRCTLWRCWTLQNLAESAQLFVGSITGPFAVVLVVVASVMTDVTSNPVGFPRENIGQFVGWLVASVAASKWVASPRSTRWGRPHDGNRGRLKLKFQDFR